MVNVVALAQKPKTSTLIVDSDLDMGAYSVQANNITSNAGTIGGITVKKDWTISLKSSSVVGFFDNINPGVASTILMLPPNQTITGTIKMNAASSNLYYMFYNVNGETISYNAMTSGDATYTVPAGTNRIVVCNYGNSIYQLKVYNYTIA